MVLPLEMVSERYRGDVHLRNNGIGSHDIRLLADMKTDF